MKQIHWGLLGVVAVLTLIVGRGWEGGHIDVAILPQGRPTSFTTQTLDVERGEIVSRGPEVSVASELTVVEGEDCLEACFQEVSIKDVNLSDAGLLEGTCEFRNSCSGVTEKDLQVSATIGDGRVSETRFNHEYLASAGSKLYGFRLYAYNYPGIGQETAIDIDTTSWCGGLDGSAYSDCIKISIKNYLYDTYGFNDGENYIFDFGVVPFRLSFQNTHNPQGVRVGINKMDTFMRYLAVSNEIPAGIVKFVEEALTIPLVVTVGDGFSVSNREPILLGCLKPDYCSQFTYFSMPGWYYTIDPDLTTYHQVVLRESISVTNDSDITDQSDVIACETDLQEMSCSCGDGFVQFGNNEECDDGNTDDTDFCSNTCQLNCQDGSECKVDTDCGEFAKCEGYMQTIPGQCTVEGMVNFEEFFSYTEFTCLSDDDCPENVSLGHGNFSEYACDLSQSVLGSQGTCECEQFIFPGCGNGVCESTRGEDIPSSSSCCNKDCNVQCSIRDAHAWEE